MPTVKEIISKVNKGEALTAEEKATLAGYDPDEATNAAAAAARRKSEAAAAEIQTKLAAAESKAAELEAKLADSAGKGKSEIDKLRADFASAAAKVAALESKVTQTEQARGALERKQTLGAIRSKAAIQFAPGLDQTMLEDSFARALDGADLADENVVKLKVSTWATMNKAAILDTTGHGSGSASHTGADDATATQRKTIQDMTPDQRAADLHKKKIV